MTTYPAGDDPFADTKLGNALTRAIVETIHEPFLVLDADLRIIVASRSFYDKFQVAKEATQGRLFYEIGEAQYDVPALRHFLTNVISEHTVMREYKLVYDFPIIGPRSLLLSAREVAYENSDHRHLLLTIGDITGQEMLIAAKEKLSVQKDLMIREMKHRMANSLQLIASILILKSEAVESQEVATHLRDAHERIMSIYTVEKYLDTTSLNEEVEVGPYLTGLCGSLKLSLIGTPIGDTKPIELRVEADGGMTTSAHGISLGLITAELVINALKHAYPGGRTGTIVVTYKSSPVGWCLAVSDDGVGISPQAPTGDLKEKKEGLGTVIVQSLARQLNATVTIESSTAGTTVSINGTPRTAAK